MSRSLEIKEEKTMATRKSTAMNTGRIPLEFAKRVSDAASAAFEDGSMAEKVTPVTRELLKHWFEEPFTNRPLNFHEGQKRAILNAIYIHEVVGAAISEVRASRPLAKSWKAAIEKDFAERKD